MLSAMGGTSRWDTARLIQLAQQGDPVADAVVRELFVEHSLPGVQRLLNSLTRNREQIPDELPYCVKRYFETLPVAESDLDKAVAGEAFFAQHGPEIMMVLCCSALPFDYANARGVEVLNQTGFLSKHPNLRVAQTAQMVVDVLAPGGLGPRGFGVRSAQKVRLMHAAIRCMLLAAPETEWDHAKLGVPISQLQLLYTLMSFTQVVLVGLKRLGLSISEQEAQAYLDVWVVVGRILGIDANALPRTVEEAEELTSALAIEAQRDTLSGKQLTDALVGLVGDVLGPLSFLRHSLIRYFTGPVLANLLGLPRQPIRDIVVGSVAWMAQAIDNFRRGSRGRQLAFRWLTLRLIQHLIDEQTSAPRRMFQIPTVLHDDWKTQTRKAA